MNGLSILLIIFGVLIILAGLSLLKGKKTDFNALLLWKTNIKHLTKEQISYAGKVTMITGLSPIISGIFAMIFEESIIPVIVLITTSILFLIIGIKLFK